MGEPETPMFQQKLLLRQEVKGGRHHLKTLMTPSAGNDLVLRIQFPTQEPRTYTGHSEINVLKHGHRTPSTHRRFRISSLPCKAPSIIAGRFRPMRLPNCPLSLPFLYTGLIIRAGHQTPARAVPWLICITCKCQSMTMVVSQGL